MKNILKKLTFFMLTFMVVGCAGTGNSESSGSPSGSQAPSSQSSSQAPSSSRSSGKSSSSSARPSSSSSSHDHVWSTDWSYNANGHYRICTVCGAKESSASHTMSIGIRLTHDDQQATIAIRDNGEQIPADKLDKIFERFYQTPTSVNDRHAGTGVGLDLTRSLVELHHGTITAHNLEEGCEFVVSIPLGNADRKSVV